VQANVVEALFCPHSALARSARPPGFRGGQPLLKEKVTAYAGVPSMRLDALCLCQTPPLAPLPACGEGMGVGLTQRRRRQRKTRCENTLRIASATIWVGNYKKRRFWACGAEAPLWKAATCRRTPKAGAHFYRFCVHPGKAYGPGVVVGLAVAGAALPCATRNHCVTLRKRSLRSNTGPRRMPPTCPSTA